MEELFRGNGTPPEREVGALSSIRKALKVHRKSRDKRFGRYLAQENHKCCNPQRVERTKVIHCILRKNETRKLSSFAVNPNDMSPYANWIEKEFQGESDRTRSTRVCKHLLAFYRRKWRSF